MGDGLVALPNDARNKEHLEWIAEYIHDANGEAIIWIARPSPRRRSAELAQQMQDSRDLEYAALLADVKQERSPTSRTVQRWRREYQRIVRRDYFRAPLRDKARLAISAAAEANGMAKEKRS